MSFETRFLILACRRISKAETQEAGHLHTVLSELKTLGYVVGETSSIPDASTVIYSDAALGCLLLEWGKSVPTDRLAVLEEAAKMFPKFDNEIQGIYRETGEDGRVRFDTYVIDEMQDS